MRSILAFVALVAMVVSIESCNTGTCTGECRCMGTDIPGGLSAENIPQLVMLTFDDAVTSANYLPTYKNLFTSTHKNPSGCGVAGTFFVTHEYNNYAELHHLWRAGSEIAVHTVTHETSTDLWATADYPRWKSEAVGMRKIIAQLAQIPEDHILGFRSPFLQTAGNVTFQMLKNEGFTYDSSLPTRAYTGVIDGWPNTDSPIWPFTFDSPLTMDCVIPPCPDASFPGLWEVPLVSFYKMRVVIPGRPPVKVPCAMADACIPWPETEDDTFEYFLDNFKRHYETNRAPFPVFLHESWLKNSERKKGYMKFFQYLLDKEDVFMVTVQEVLEFIKNPQPLGEYQETRCITTKQRAKCTAEGKYCYYEKSELDGPRTLFTCTPGCPQRYPWLDTQL